MLRAEDNIHPALILGAQICMVYVNLCHGFVIHAVIVVGVYLASLVGHTFFLALGRASFSTTSNVLSLMVLLLFYLGIT